MERSHDPSLSKAVIDLLSPGPFQCYLCRNEAVLDDLGLCEDCRAVLRLCPHPSFLPPLDGLSVGLQYTEPVKNAILRLKMQRDYTYAPFFVQFMEIPTEWHADLLVPIPMHPFRKWLRGFNHSELLAEYLSSKYEIPFTRELLTKQKWTGQQKRLSAEDRRRNIRDSFRVERSIPALGVVLIDDVFTTGATLYECAKILKKAGAAYVYGCCASSPVL